MEKLTKDITDTIIAEVNNANEKVKGLNFLELLKINLIQKLLKLLNEQKFPLEKEFVYENQIKTDLRNAEIIINYFLNSISISKKIIKNNSLFLFFNEFANFDIYKNEKNFTSLLLYRNTGLSLPKDTIINSQYNKNLLLVEIIDKDVEEILTK